MLDRVPRKDKHVSDLIEITDARLAEAKGVVAAAFDRMSPTEIEAITHEIRRVSAHDPASMRYFLENYFVISTKGDDLEPPRIQTMHPFKDSQEVLWEDFELCWQNKWAVWWLLLKARQLGWSTQIQGMIFHRTIFNRHMRSLVIADEKVRATHIFEMSLNAYNNLPFWMRPEVQNMVKGELLKFDRKDALERAIRPGLNSALHVDAANKPSGSSRGFTLHNLHASEISRWIRMKILTSDILPAVSKTNPLTILAVEGTAEGRGVVFHKLWKKAMEGKLRFRPIFAGYWKEKAYSKPFSSEEEKYNFTLTKEEQALVDKVWDECQYRLTAEQLNWRREEMAVFEATEGDAENFEQEYPSYPESAFRSTGITAFPKKRLAEVQLHDVRKPIWFGELVYVKDSADGKEKPKFVEYGPGLEQQAPLWVWEWPKSGELYYQASDPGHGIPGKDFSTIQIFRVPRKNGERIRQCMEFQDYAPASKLSRICCSLGHFYNSCEMAPECNTLTEHIGNIINIYKYPRIYRWRRRDKIKNRYTHFFGWETQFKSRNDLITRFRSLLMDEAQGVHMRSMRLLDECYAFVDDGTGRFEAADDNHDDLLFSAMIAVYCLMELDPKLLEELREQPIPVEGRDFINTDYSPEFDDPVNSDTPDFSML